MLPDLNPGDTETELSFFFLKTLGKQFLNPKQVKIVHAPPLTSSCTNPEAEGRHTSMQAG